MDLQIWNRFSVVPPVGADWWSHLYRGKQLLNTVTHNNALRLRMTSLWVMVTITVPQQVASTLINP